MARTALVAGATGLVGGHLLRRLLEDTTWERVISVGRRQLNIQHPRLEQRVVDFSSVGTLPHIDDAFSTLGTTIKKAGSQSAFYAVDHDAVLAVARAAREAGAERFLHVTAIGASAGSRIFYNRVKGETERDVAALGFPLAIAFRPSLIDGERLDRRPTEQLSLAVARAFAPVLGKLAPTHADDIAKAMLLEARGSRHGSITIEADEIRAIAR